MLFVPLSVASSYFIIFPYLFDKVLNAPEHSPIALFINGILTVSLQSTFSRKINLTKKQLVRVSPLLAVAIIAPWFVAVKFATLIAAYIYTVIFTFVEVFALTAMANLLVKFDNGTHRGFIFGSSRLILSITTVITMNLVPVIFLFKITSGRFHQFLANKKPLVNRNSLTAYSFLFIPLAFGSYHKLIPIFDGRLLLVSKDKNWLQLSVVRVCCSGCQFVLPSPHIDCNLVSTDLDF